MFAGEFFFTEAGVCRVAALNSFLKRSQVYLKRSPTWKFWWEVSRNFPSAFPIFQNADGQTLPKIKTSCSLEHQSREISNCAEIVSVCKWYWCRITKKEERILRCIGCRCYIFSQKKICKRKIIFLKCLCHCWCCADGNFQDNDFYITLMRRFPNGL